MLRENYTLEVVSQHPSFKNKILKKYFVDGVPTIGAWGDEPFEIRFKNNTYNKIQVKITLDGTDILTSKPGTTEVTKDMWLVEGYGTLALKAWPETSKGGAAFVFTSAENSVASHTHGDMSSRGIIAAAVYTEGHIDLERSFDEISETSYNAPSAAGAAGAASAPEVKSKRLVSVGAGQHVEQKIRYVPGLIKPVFSEVVKVKYMWYDDLVAKLKAANYAYSNLSGFPADKEKHIMSIGDTPRVGDPKKAEAAKQEYQYDRF